MKRRIINLIMICILFTLAQTAVSFGASGQIVGFAPLEENEFYYEGEPSREELVASLPQEIGVYLEGQDEPVMIPVCWEPVEDYEGTDFYFYSARPVELDGLEYAPGVDPLTDVPWITLFRQKSQEEISDGEEPVDIPVSNLEELTTGESGDGKPETSSSRLQGSLSLAKILSLCTEKSYAGKASNESKIYSYLTETMGLNMAAACGVMTNLYAESGMQPNNLENIYNKKYGLSDEEYTKRVNKGKNDKGKYKSGYGKTRYFTTDYSGYGICQWTTSGRRTKVLNAAVKKDVSIANLNMQLGVLNSELQESYAQVWATLRNVPNNATGVYLSAAHFCAAFEIPANTNATAASRAKTALSTYWENYSGKSASVSGKSFLGLCGYTYPKTVKKGTGMTVSGHVISNYKIKSVTVKILNSKGNAVYSSTKKPGATIYSLYNFDSSMKFSKLSKGSYTYVITAKDSKGKSVKAEHAFTVDSNHKGEYMRGCATKDTSTSAPVKSSDPADEAESTLKGVSLNYPETLKKKEKFNIAGKVKSNYNLKEVQVIIKDAEGKNLQKGKASLSTAKSYNVKKLRKKLRFEKLSKGKYTYQVKASDEKKTKTLLKKEFRVK